MCSRSETFEINLKCTNQQIHPSAHVSLPLSVDFERKGNCTFISAFSICGGIEKWMQIFYFSAKWAEGLFLSQNVPVGKRYYKEVCAGYSFLCHLK